MNVIRPLLTLILCVLFFPVQAQNYKFGKVSKEELTEQSYPLDSSAHAAILYKNRTTKFEYYQNQGWRLITTIHERIKLYDKDGFQWASKTIKLYNNNERETVSLKAFTYNLENGKVTKTKLSNKEIFEENINKYWDQKKFTMPNLNEGGIVEWEYAITSPFFWKIDDVNLQAFIPIKKIDSKVVIPEYFTFKNVSKGFLPFNLSNSTTNSSISYIASDNENWRENSKKSIEKIEFKSIVTECHLTDVPALKDEPYVNNIQNYRSSLNYELTSTQFPNSQIDYYATTWDDVSKTINESEGFGGQLTKSGHFKDELVRAVNASAPTNEKIISVFNFVKSKLKWNDYTGIYTTNGVRKAYKDGVGNVAELNLNLVAMLREVGLNANPVLTSTRNHGIPIFPTTDGFNYVIAAVELPAGIVLLDATEPYSLPNVLPIRTINWQGRLVRKDGSSMAINLFPNQYASEKTTLAVKVIDEGIEGNSRTVFDNHSALHYRTSYAGVAQDNLKSKFEKDYGGIEIEHMRISNDLDLSKPVMVNAQFSSDQHMEMIGDKLYIAPLLYLTEDENPFKLATREFPVDFGTPWEENYAVSIEIPEGYTITSIPEDLAIGLPDQLGSYKFMAVVKGNKLQILSHLKINSALFGPNYYVALKQFYQQLVDKQVEKIVLSKS